MSDYSNLWECETAIAELPESASVNFDHEIPKWIDQSISPNTIAAIIKGNCSSGHICPP